MSQFNVTLQIASPLQVDLSTAPIEAVLTLPGPQGPPGGGGSLAGDAGTIPVWDAEGDGLDSTTLYAAGDILSGVGSIIFTGSACDMTAGGTIRGFGPIELKDNSSIKFGVGDKASLRVRERSTLGAPRTVALVVPDSDADIGVYGSTAFRPTTWTSGTDNDTTPSLGETVRYTSNTSFTVPAGATWCELEAIGGGGGGGSGGVGTTGAATGGCGGQGGQKAKRVASLAELGWTAGTTSVSVTVGSAGTGGARKPGNTAAAGNEGTAGGSTTLVANSVTVLTASGGQGGYGGLSSAGGRFPITNRAGCQGTKQGAGGVWGAATTVEGIANAGGPGGGSEAGGGGGGGGAVNGSGTTYAGGAGGGGEQDDTSDYAGGGGAAGSSGGGAGSAGSANTLGGDGGGGGGGGNSASAGDGADGAGYGGAGGGGGGLRSTNVAHNSGKGGDGTAGAARVRFW